MPASAKIRSMAAAWLSRSAAARLNSPTRWLAASGSRPTKAIRIPLPSSWPGRLGELGPEWGATQGEGGDPRVGVARRCQHGDAGERAALPRAGGTHDESMVTLAEAEADRRQRVIADADREKPVAVLNGRRRRQLGQ